MVPGSLTAKIVRPQLQIKGLEREEMCGQILPGHFPHGENFNAHVIALGQKQIWQSVEPSFDDISF